LAIALNARLNRVVHWNARIPSVASDCKGDTTMQIYGPSQLHGAQSINGPHTTRTAPASGSSSSNPISDQLDISQAGQLAARLSDVPDIRADRVSQIREALANGTYESDDKLNTALDRLLDEIA